MSLISLAELMKQCTPRCVSAFYDLLEI